MPSIKSDFIKSKYIVEGLIKYCDKIKVPVIKELIQNCNYNTVMYKCLKMQTTRN